MGGPAQKILQVSTQEEIIAAIEEAGDSPILILGGGTNVLVADSGFAGTVMRISNNSVQAEFDACSGATLFLFPIICAHACNELTDFMAIGTNILNWRGANSSWYST